MTLKKVYSLLFVGTLSCVLCLGVCASFAAERVVVVGDSITGHSMNLPYGFTHEIRAALSEANSDVEFVPLGGSGQTIFSWRNIIANSYENNQRLDIEGIFVKEEFDKGADTILVHLGMNDALQPSIKSDEEGFASWKKEYVSLIDDLRKRVPNVKRIVLTPPTMLTEEDYAFKNVLMDRFASIIEEVAIETNCEFEDTRAEFKRFVNSVRLLDPDFRFTLDFVHPNQFGHQVMSWSFLKGLGLDNVAQKYYETKISPEIRDFTSPGMSLTVCDKTQVDVFNIDKIFFNVVVNTRGIPEAVSADAVEIKTSGNLQINAVKKTDASGQFIVELSGSTADLPADLDVQIGSIERVLRLNAPYFVATGFVLADGASFSTPENYPKDKAFTEIDQATLDGKDPLKESFESPIDGQKLSWTMYFPTQFKTGANNPNAVDISIISPANAFEGAYVVRYIRSPKAQRCTLKLNSEGFSTTAIETIYLNGKEIYFDTLSPRHIKAKDELEVDLKEGLNILVSRVDHTYWQWATSFSFENAEGLSF
ncbi:MAG: hypothetical protein IKX88_11195 [Thermoguttaceae bacterium]|nr:hypothetical protein [Thermoguttaceae bacterium]MBR5759147.1 hypothetical protein [Thermoguttaceae bacterium]